MNRRTAILGVGALAGLTLGGRAGIKRLARQADPDAPLSSEAEALVRRAAEGIDPERVLDSHVHLVGLGAGGTGCWVNPKMESAFSSPVSFFKFNIYRHASGVEDDLRGDAQYVERLAALARAQRPGGKLLLLAFDLAHDEGGAAVPEHSEFYTPNDYAVRVAREHPDVFRWAASVHPYRRDAVDELQRCLEEGATAVKWLPNAHRIDPSSPRCDPFYRVLADRGVPLITHGGEEQAVDAEEAQLLGNPLLLRRPLEAGVKVVISHCASLGDSPDLEHPDRPEVPAFDLFLRLMAEERYRGRLFGDLSALCQANRCERPLAELLQRAELHDRCLNSSDYPLPAINALVRTGKLQSLGYITAAERRALNELDQHNPLLFDFVLKRTVRLARAGKEHRFPDTTFMVPPGLFPA